MGLGAKYLSVMGMDFSLVTFLKKYSLLGVTGARTTAATTSPSWPTTWRRAPWAAAGRSSHRSSGSPVPRRQHLPTTTSSSLRLSPRSGTLCVTKWVYSFQNFFKNKKNGHISTLSRSGRLVGRLSQKGKKYFFEDFPHSGPHNGDSPAALHCWAACWKFPLWQAGRQVW